jgi:hypothetical protein
MAVALGGCGENRAISEWKEEKEARAKAAANTNKVNGPRVQPDGDVDLLVKELTAEEKVVGEYEHKDKDGNIHRYVFLENGVFEGYTNGKKTAGEPKWKLGKDGELHIEKLSNIAVLRINNDGSITIIAAILGGKRIEAPKDEQFTVKKIK